MRGGIWVATAATLAVLLSLIGNMAANTVALSVRWVVALWVLVGLLGAAAVALAVLQYRIEQRQVPSETLRSGGGSAEWLAGRVLFLVDGRLPKMNEVNLLQLRVKPAIDTLRSDGADLPLYVPRDVDDDLEWAITTGGLVLLHGRAAVGKSRTAAEALCRLRSENSLVVPVDGPALRELVESGYDLGEAVVWLDDFEQFLKPGGLDLALLQQMCPAKSSRVAVVATIRDNELAAFEARAAKRDAASGIDRAVIDLLAQIRGRRRIAVAQYLSPDERKAAAEIGGRDGRIGRAVRAEEGFAEYLAAGTAMMDRWAIGDGPLFQVGQAIISAAVDCRRAGCHQPIPATTLTDLYCQYLSPAWRDRSDLPAADKALGWASQPLLGASSCLQPRANHRYLASDYLLDRAQTGTSPLRNAAVPPRTWRTLIDRSTPDDVFGIGVQAYSARVLDIAETAFTKLIDAGATKALNNLGLLLADQGRYVEAETRYRQAIDAGDTCALVNLGNMYRARDRLADAETCYRRAIDAGNTGALASLGTVLAEQGRMQDAEAHYREAIDAGDGSAAFGLGVVLAEQGRLGEAEECYRRAADAGDEAAVFNLGVVLAEQGQLGEAEQCYRRAADAGDVMALFNLGVVLAQQRRHDEAEICYVQAIDAGSVDALNNLGALLAEQGRRAETEDCYRRAADAGDVMALFNLGVVLAQQHRFDEAEICYRQAIDAGNVDALNNLGALLAEQGRCDQAETYYRRAIDAGKPTALNNLRTLLRTQGRADDAEAWDKPAAAERSPHARAATVRQPRPDAWRRTHDNGQRAAGDPRRR